MAEVPPFLWADAGSFTSPHTYKVPGAGEVQPYTSTATYVNGSAQAILPALRIKSQSGNLLALVFPSTTIAAGGTSEVSFVPPFGSAAVSATATGTSLPTAFGSRKNFTAANNATTNCYPFDTFLTNDATVYAQDGGTGALSILTTGLYRVDEWLNMYSATVLVAQAPTLDVDLPGGAPPNSFIDIPYGTNFTVVGRTLPSGLRQWQLSATSWYNIESGTPSVVTFRIIGGGASANTWSVQAAVVAATRVGDAQTFDLSTLTN